jgi:hypothetical protein
VIAPWVPQEIRRLEAERRGRAQVTKGCAFPCFGYQLDWVIYKGAELSFVDGEADPGPLEPGSEAAFCSDHGALSARFRVQAV